MEMCNPAAMLYTAVRENGSYSSMLQEALRVRPSTPDEPWRFAVYSDEVTPGNVMAPDNLRRVWIFYWALLALSMQSLYTEDAWYLLCAKRSSEVSKVPGGVSAIMAACLEAFFYERRPRRFDRRHIARICQRRYCQAILEVRPDGAR